jgi:hypothetical protein
MRDDFIDIACASWCATIIILGVLAIFHVITLVPKDAWAAALKNPTDEQGFESSYKH